MRSWVNGELLDDPGRPAIAANDHGMVVGDGVFESIKVVHGQPFALTRHLQRLARSAQGMGLPEPDEAEVRRGVAAVLDAAPIGFGIVRITWTAGPGPLGSARGDGPATLAIAATDVPARTDTTAVITVPWPRNERGALAGLKTTSYGENVVALAEARRHDATEAIFANTIGNLCEGTGSNVFYVVDGELRTPTLASGCLAGVSRALLLEWFGAREVDEPIGILTEAAEILLTSTTRDVQGVHRCDDRGLTAPGPMTLAAMRAWSEHERRSVDP